MTSFLSKQGLFFNVYDISVLSKYLGYYFSCIHTFFIYWGYLFYVKHTFQISRVFLCIEVRYVCQGYSPTISFQISRVFSCIEGLLCMSRVSQIASYPTKTILCLYFLNFVCVCYVILASFNQFLVKFKNRVRFTSHIWLLCFNISSR